MLRRQVYEDKLGHCELSYFLYFPREWRELQSSVALANVFFAFSYYLTENTVSIRKPNHGDIGRSSYKMSVIFVRIERKEGCTGKFSKYPKFEV